MLKSSKKNLNSSLSLNYFSELEQENSVHSKWARIAIKIVGGQAPATWINLAKKRAAAPPKFFRAFLPDFFIRDRLFTLTQLKHEVFSLLFDSHLSAQVDRLKSFSRLNCSEKIALTSLPIFRPSSAVRRHGSSAKSSSKLSRCLFHNKLSYLPCYPKFRCKSDFSKLF